MGEFGRAARGSVAPTQPAISALDGEWELRALTGELCGLLDGNVLGRRASAADPVADEPTGRHARSMDPTPIYHSMTRGGWRGRLVEVSSTGKPDTPAGIPGAPAPQPPMPLRRIVPPQAPPSFWDGSPSSPTSASDRTSDNGPDPNPGGSRYNRTGRHHRTPDLIPDLSAGRQNDPWRPAIEHRH